VEDLPRRLTSMAKIKIVPYGLICTRNMVGVFAIKRIGRPINDKFYKKFK
jgi:hypothetical protein